MRKMLFVLMGVCLISMAQAAVLSYEGFSGYTVGSQLDDDVPSPAVAGYTGDWTLVDWGAQQAIVQSGSLAYGTSSGDSVGVPYIAGGEITSGNSGRVYRLLDGTLTVTDATAGTVYLSWLFQSGQETGSTTYQMLDLYNSDTADANRNFTAGLTNNGGNSGTQYDFGVDESYTSTGVDADTAVHMFVVRFDLSATAASDSVTVWLDPVSETDPGITVSGVDLTFDRLSISDYDGNSAGWDEIRWGTTFDDVLPGILYESPADGADFIPVARTASENDLVFTITNTNIADVEIYLSENDPNATDLIKTITSVGTGQQTVTLETEWPTDLAFDTPYYWKVIGYEPNAVSGQNDIPVAGPVWSFTTAPEAPLIIADPAPYTAVDAGEPSLALTADGINGTLKWYKDGFAIDDGADYAGTTTGTLTIYDVQLADEGDYTLKVTNDPLVAESTAGRVMIHRQTSYYDFESITTLPDGNDVFEDSIDGYNAVLAQDAASAGLPTSVSDVNSISGLGAYLYLDNADHATDPNGQYLQVYPGVVDYEDLTITLWAQPLGGNEWQRIIDFGNGTTDYMFLAPDAGGSGGLRYATRIKDGSEQTLNTGVLTPGSWSFVAVTISGDTGKLYVDGEWRATNTGLTIDPLDVGAVLNYIGKSQYPDAEFNGYIDDLKIYNYARTNEQIAQDYMAVSGAASVCDAEALDLGDYDANGDCVISLPDFAAFAARWLEADQFYPAP